MDTSTMNIILDVILVIAGIWMVITVRGVGGVVGQTLNFIVAGALVTGFAHLLATLTPDMFKVFNEAGEMTANYGGTVHRAVVLVGFFLLVFGFRQLGAIKR